MKIIQLIILGTAALSLSGCAPRIGGSDYALRGVGEISQTQQGTVIGKRTVKVSGSPTTEGDNKPGVGATAGAVTGALLGSTVGRGRGHLVGATLGALAGGAAGHFIERGLTDQDGIEYQIKLDSGSVVVVVQGPDPVVGVGQRVSVVHSGRDRSRVIPL